MNSKARRIVESPLYQGVDESIAYSLDTSAWGGSPVSPSVTLKNELGEDVSANHLTGVAGVNGDNVITPFVSNLEVGTYRLEIQWITGGNTLEAYAVLRGQE